ncbi:hypothetical protein LguiA_002897 [Lonicera macranthoides]
MISMTPQNYEGLTNKIPNIYPEFFQHQAAKNIMDLNPNIHKIQLHIAKIKSFFNLSYYQQILLETPRAFVKNTITLLLIVKLEKKEIRTHVSDSDPCDWRHTLANSCCMTGKLTGLSVRILPRRDQVCFGILATSGVKEENTRPPTSSSSRETLAQAYSMSEIDEEKAMKAIKKARERGQRKN